MLVLHGFVPAWGLPDFSPFCNKLHTYLRMRGLEYQTKVADPRKAPLGKLPRLQLADGTMVYDSRLIIELLESENTEPMDAHLARRERATAEAMRSALEEHFYFVLVYLHFKYDRGWQEFLPVWKNYAAAIGMPSFVFHPALFFARRNVLRDLRGQGTGRHDLETVRRFGKELVTSLADSIGDGPYITGERPTTYDATAYAFTAAIVQSEFTCPVREHAKRQQNLLAYLERMRERYFVD
jgi:glutathione S-transferase